MNHAIVKPPVDRHKPAEESKDVFVCVQKEVDGGTIVSGAKVVATSAAMTHYNFMGQASKTATVELDMSLMFLVPIDAPGLKQPYTYSIPEGIELSVGDSVVTAFAGRMVTGYIVGIAAACPPGIQSKIRAITAKIEGGSMFDQDLLDLSYWVTENTLCDLRDAVRLIAPEILSAQIATQWRLAEDWSEMLRTTRSEAQRAVAAALADSGGASSVGKLSKLCPGVVLGPILAELRRVDP